MKNSLALGFALFVLGACNTDTQPLSSEASEAMASYQPSRATIPGVMWAAFNDSCLPYYGDKEFGLDEFGAKLKRITGQNELSQKEKGSTLLGEDARIWRLSYPGGQIDIGVSSKRLEACVATDDRIDKKDLKKFFEEVQADPRYEIIQKCSLISEADLPTEIWILDNRLFQNVATVSLAVEHTKGTQLAVFAMPENRLKGLNYLVDQCIARVS